MPQPLEPSTVGIKIKEGWEFEHIDHPGTPFLVNLWDFGGQPIQHMTHQFFLLVDRFMFCWQMGEEM